MENSLRFELPKDTSSIIKVIGVGGGGSNAVNYMYEQGIKGVDFIVCNTDAQDLDKSPVPIKVQLGSTLTAGRGAGSIPEVGKNSAIESLEDIRAILSESTNMVFITAGMGGGTGTGAAPVIARIAKEMGILTVGIVTIPFVFEGRKRSIQADIGIIDMRDSVDTLLIIRNDKLRELYGNLSLRQAFSHADEVLCTATKGIAEVITLTGTVNVDMNDVKTVMHNSGVAIMGSGRASGECRASRAVHSALESPLLNDNDINGANFILLNITHGNHELLMDEISEITDIIQEQAGSDAEVIWGYGQDDSLGDDICVTVIATGFQAKTVENILPVQKEEPKKMWLETDTPKEIVQKVEKPTSSVEPVKNEWREEEPFVLNKNVEFEIKNLINEEKPSVPDQLSKSGLPEVSSLKIHLKEEISQMDNQSVTHTPEIAPVADILSSTSDIPSDQLKIGEDKQVSDRPARTELLARNREREGRIREFTQKLKTPGGLNDLESEPAYLRRKVSLDNVRHSSESNISKFALNESTDESGEKKFELRDNNPFLHDNVD
ncbi:MAG: cell division protein FtsZ [Crocinitomicaceae bacterium]|nr:cell division protein FtsZ [Crocinitomicaceae bacterium]